MPGVRSRTLVVSLGYLKIYTHLSGLSAAWAAFPCLAMSTATDVLRAKTDAELHFFVDNPGYYHADLVAAARQELQRRGLSPTPAASAPIDEAYYAEEDEPSSNRRPLLIAAAVLGFVGVGGALLWSGQPAAKPLAAPRSPHSLTLESVDSHPIPSFDIDKMAADQVAHIPAAEKKKAQELRQFRGLCERFWAAEAQTEFLTAQAHAGQAGPLFADQTLVARETWRAWNKAAVYGYHFGPVMQEQYQRMAKTASSQQHILTNLPDLLNGRKFLTDKEMLAREAETQDWLSGLRKVSPVTGQPYRVTVMQLHI
jgi:hypothetical protein